MGDQVAVTLTVHTSGSAIQNVFSNTPATVDETVELTGVSDPDNPGDGLAWTVDLEDLAVTLTAYDVNGTGPQTVDPMTWVITGLDQMNIQGVTIDSLNEFGITPAQITFTANSITVIVPEGSLALLPLNGSLATKLHFIIPEPSTLVLALLASLGLIGFVRKRRMRH